MVQPKIKWPPNAVQRLLGMMDNHKGEGGRLNQGDSKLFDELAQTLGKEFPRVPNFSKVLDGSQVESKLRAIWNTYKRSEYGSNPSPITPFYSQGTQALDAAKVLRYLGISVTAGEGGNFGPEQGGQQRKDQGGGNTEEDDQDGEGGKDNNNGGDRMYNNESETWLDGEPRQQEGASEQDLSDSNPSKRRRVLEILAKRVVNEPRARRAVPVR